MNKATLISNDTFFRTAKDWLDDSGYLLRENILKWLQSLVSTVLSKTKLEILKEVRVVQIKTMCRNQTVMICAYCVGVSLGPNLI